MSKLTSPHIVGLYIFFSVKIYRTLYMTNDIKHSIILVKYNAANCAFDALSGFAPPLVKKAPKIT